jgi:hypothetical protein
MGEEITGRNLDSLLGDGSGKLETSGVDEAKAADYGRRIFWAVVFVRFSECKQIHNELNQDVEMYQAALNKFREWCIVRGKPVVSKWPEYTSD